MDTGGDKSAKDKPAFSFQAITEIFKGSTGFPTTPKSTQVSEDHWKDIKLIKYPLLSAALGPVAEEIISVRIAENPHISERKLFKNILRFIK